MKSEPPWDEIVAAAAAPLKPATKRVGAALMRAALKASKDPTPVMEAAAILAATLCTKIATDEGMDPEQAWVEICAYAFERAANEGAGPMPPDADKH